MTLAPRAPSAPDGRRAAPSPPRKRRWWWLAAGIVAALAIGFATWLWFDVGSGVDPDGPSDAPVAPPVDVDRPSDEVPGTDEPSADDRRPEPPSDTDGEPPEEPPATDDPADPTDPAADDPTDPGDPGPVIRYGQEPPGTWDVTGVATADRLNVRSGPGTTYPVIATLAPDTVGLESTGRTAQVDGVLWRELVVREVGTGWVHARFLASHTAAPTPPPDPEPSALPASLRGAEWERIPTSRKVVALTFDAGANADGVPAILRTLEATDTPATFFLTGRWTEAHPDLARRIASSYPVGNHSVTHPAFTTLSDAQVRREVGDAEGTITRIAGRSPRPLFRFPFGDRDARTIRLVNDAGYGSIRWTVDTLGWKGTSGGMSASAVVDRVVATAGPGQIVLLHVGSHPTDGSTLDADALPRIISELKARGYRFVTLPEALRIAER